MDIKELNKLLPNGYKVEDLKTEDYNIVSALCDSINYVQTFTTPPSKTSLLVDKMIYEIKEEALKEAVELMTNHIVHLTVARLDSYVK
jgi:hypothetical protein